MQFKYINVPLSIVEQRWFKNERAVRAWFFYAWNSIFSSSKTIKGHLFNLSQGELICTRSYVAKSLGIKESAAKSGTDSLRRTGTISVKQEVLAPKSSKNKLSHIYIKGVPVPTEPYLRLDLPVEASILWTTPNLLQLYIYMMCKAYREDTVIFGTKGRAKRVGAGDVVVKYKDIEEVLRMKEWRLKECFRQFEDIGAISPRERVANCGILVHLLLYPKHEKKPAVVRQTNNKPKPKKKTEEDARTINETPVTSAIKYLYFDLKRNKDVSRLNSLISFISENLPSEYPINILREAVDFYYQEYGSAYLEPKALLSFLLKYQKFKGPQVTESERQYALKKLGEKEAAIREESKAFIDAWETIARAYDVYISSGHLPTSTPDEIDKIYYQIWTANLKRHYVDASLLGDKRDHAAYLGAFFSTQSKDSMRKIFENEKNILFAEHDKSIREIEEQKARVI